jgi:hypothetical protein
MGFGAQRSFIPSPVFCFALWLHCSSGFPCSCADPESTLDFVTRCAVYATHEQLVFSLPQNNVPW